MSFYVYVLKSNKGRYYIGYTSNLQQRIEQHNWKHRGFTGGQSEIWQLFMSKEFATKHEAMSMEKYLKSLKNSKKAIDYLEKLQ